jgi:hypothetical protein
VTICYTLHTFWSFDITHIEKNNLGNCDLLLLWIRSFGRWSKIISIICSSVNIVFRVLETVAIPLFIVVWNQFQAFWIASNFSFRVNLSPWRFLWIGLDRKEGHRKISWLFFSILYSNITKAWLHHHTARLLAQLSCNIQNSKITNW